MNWKDKLSILEQSDDFDVAVFFMQKVIKEHSADVDAYIYMLFRLMDTIVEHACYFSNVSRTPVSDIKKMYYDMKEDYYSELAIKYFNEGYARFSENAEFLYYVGITAAMSEWYFNIEREDYDKMLAKAMTLEPHNPLYKDSYYFNLAHSLDENDKNAVKIYALSILNNNSNIQNMLKSKGAVGAYRLEILINWSKEIIEQRDPVIIK